MPTDNHKVPTDDRLVLRLTDLQRALGIKRTCIEQLMKNGDLPKPIRLGPQSTGWLASEIHDWLHDRATMRDHEEA